MQSLPQILPLQESGAQVVEMRKCRKDLRQQGWHLWLWKPRRGAETSRWAGPEALSLCLCLWKGQPFQPNVVSWRRCSPFSSLFLVFTWSHYRCKRSFKDGTETVSPSPRVFPPFGPLGCISRDYRTTVKPGDRRWCGVCVVLCHFVLCRFMWPQSKYKCPLSPRRPPLCCPCVVTRPYPERDLYVCFSSLYLCYFEKVYIKEIVWRVTFWDWLFHSA